MVSSSNQSCSSDSQNSSHSSESYKPSILSSCSNIDEIVEIENSNYRRMNQQDLEMIENLAYLAKQNEPRLFGGEEQLKLKEANKYIAKLNREFEVGIQDLKDKKVNLQCTIHFDKDCLIEQLILGKNMYYAKNCSCKAIYCSEVLRERKCPTCRKENVNFTPVVRGDLYLAKKFNSLMRMYNYSAQEDTPKELKIVMVRLAYISNVLKQDTQRIIESLKSKEQQPQEPQSYYFTVSNKRVQIPEFLDYSSCNKKLTDIIKTYQDAFKEVENILNN